MAHQGMSELAKRAVHSPCSTIVQTMLGRYAAVTGDLAGRLVVARYAQVFNGDPVWHASCMVKTPDGPPRERAEWSRRDRRQAERYVERIIGGLGDGETLDLEGAAVDGISLAYAVHRIRRLRRDEWLHTPPDFRAAMPIDLEGVKS